MVSVIISSADNFLLEQVTKNIAETIGVPYEIIATDNSAGKQGICSVYNKGILKAKYDILCFMHEDLLMKTNNWGQILITLFNQNPLLGLVGLAGNSYKPITPSGLGGIGADTHYTNIIQSYKRNNLKTEHIYINPGNKSLASVVCVDGVWMATTKKIAKEFMFDEITFRGFHAYDVDFSLSVGQKYKVAVTFDVLLDHFSEGYYGETWMKETLKLHDKWYDHLPVNVGGLTSKQISHVEKKTFKELIEQLIRFNYPIGTAFKILWKCKRFFSLHPTLLFKLYFYIIKKYLSLSKAKS